MSNVFTVKNCKNINIDGFSQENVLDSKTYASISTKNMDSFIQNLQNSLTQSASATAKGLFVPSATADNNIRNVVDQSVAIGTTVVNSLSKTIKEMNEAAIACKNGTATIRNMSQSNTTKTLTKVVYDTLNKSSAVQKLSNTITQTAKATAVGLSLADLIVIAILMILAPISLGLMKKAMQNSAEESAKGAVEGSGTNEEGACKPKTNWTFFGVGMLFVAVIGAWVVCSRTFTRRNPICPTYRRSTSTPNLRHRFNANLRHTWEIWSKIYR